jgi:PHP family Zn ribbon phosphoesterase
MNHSQKVLAAAMPAVHELDQLIKQLEQNLGKAHTISPFTNLYA